MAGKNIQQEKELKVKICFLFSPQEALAALMSGIEWLCSGVIIRYKNCVRGIRTCCIVSWFVSVSVAVSHKQTKSIY